MAGVQGYDDLHATPPKATTFSGLSAPDPYTFVVKLKGPSHRIRFGCFQELAASGWGWVAR